MLATKPIVIAFAFPFVLLPTISARFLFERPQGDSLRRRIAIPDVATVYETVATAYVDATTNNVQTQTTCTSSDVGKVITSASSSNTSPASSVSTNMYTQAAPAQTTDSQVTDTQVNYVQNTDVQNSHVQNGVKQVDKSSYSPPQPDDPTNNGLYGPGGIPLISDVQQHATPDCWLSATLAAIAYANYPALQRLMTPSKDGSVINVLLYANGIQDTYPIAPVMDSIGEALSNVIANSTNPDPATWPATMELGLKALSKKHDELGISIDLNTPGYAETAFESHLRLD